MLLRKRIIHITTQTFVELLSLLYSVECMTISLKDALIAGTHQTIIKLVVAFMDYEEAFDYANRMNIISDLISKGCGSQMTKAIANMYISTEYLPRLKGDKLGEAIVTKYSVTQGRSHLLIFSHFM